MSCDTSKLGEVAEVIDSLHKTPKYSESGYPIVRVTDVKYGPLKLNKTYKVDEAVYKDFSRRYTPEVGDIIITRVGSYGNSAFVTDTNFCLGQNTAAIKPKINSRYLYYVLNSKTLQQQIEFSTVGSTQKTLSLKAISNLEIPRFAPAFEKSVAKICGDLDDKIESNKQINQTLEQIAQAIFKSWFVDFEPVKAKINALEAGGSEQDALLAAMQAISGKDKAQLTQLQTENPEHYNELRTTAELFPSALEDSELGEIPEGWGVDNLSKLIEFNPRRTLKKGAPAPYLDMKNVPTSGHLAEEVVIREMKSGTKFINGDTLLARITPCLENGKTAYVDFVEDKQVGWGSTEYIVMRAQESYPEPLSYFIARDSHFREHAIRTMTGTSGRQRANAKALADLPWVIYPLGLVNAFNKLAQPYLDIAKRNGDESQTLSALRDTLLPKLLSGELQVNSTDRIHTKLPNDKDEHDLNALISEIENELPPKSHFVVHESSRKQRHKLGMIGYSTTITGDLGQGGAEYFKLPAFLSELRSNKILQGVFSTVVDSATGVPFLMVGITTVLNKFLGEKIKLEQRTAIVLLSFPENRTCKISQLLCESKKLILNAGLPPLDEDSLSGILKQLKGLGLVTPRDQAFTEWTLVEKFEHKGARRP